jgi:hypothetical protein
VIGGSHTVQLVQMVAHRSVRRVSNGRFHKSIRIIPKLRARLGDRQSALR